MRAPAVTRVTSVFFAFGFAAFAALASAQSLGCAPPSVGELPDDDTPLPNRKPASNGDNGNGTTSSSSGSTSSSSSGGASSSGTPTPPAPSSFALTVTLKGTGTGSITSTPGGVTCTAGVCKGTFAKGTSVTLVAAPVSGSLFAGYTGACTGAACATTVTADTALTAEFQPLDGAWTGTYTNNRPANGCNFTNAGNLTINVAQSAGAFTNAGNIDGLELRNLNGCGLVGKTTGTAPAESVTIDSTKVTGTWTFAVSGASGSLDFPFTATISGTKMTGTWTCTGCTGDFTLTKQ